MSSSYGQRKDVITHDVMYIIERWADESLHTRSDRIRYDSQVLSRLKWARERMLEWEEERGEQLVNELAHEGMSTVHESRFPVSYFGSHSQVEGIATAFFHRCNSVYRRIGMVSGARLMTSHGMWQFDTDIYCLSEYAEFIKGFDVSLNCVMGFQSSLENHEFQKLKSDYDQAIKLQSCLLRALDDYEKAFFKYTEEVNRILPGILKPKSYCRGFNEKYGDADLDYDMSPGNQCIVENIGEYYHASVLEELYRAYDRGSDIVAYSHRKRGFFDYLIVLDPKCDLQLLARTNFGFGRSAYFLSTLSYKGVNAINAQFLIYYRVVGMASQFNCTDRYEVAEESFGYCFDNAVKLHAEYREIGEAKFVDKYFRKSLDDLSKLLAITANTDTFLSITSLDRFHALTARGWNELIPGEQLERAIKTKLTEREERYLDEIVPTVTEGGNNRDDAIDCARKRVGKLLFPNGSSGLEPIVKRHLVRSFLTSRLVSSLGNNQSVSNYVDEIVPSDNSAYVEAYAGFDLIRMRIERALSVIRSIARLREIAALTLSDSIIDDILSTCIVIGGQAQQYDLKKIAPKLHQLVPERDRVKGQLDELESEMKAAWQSASHSGWIREQIETLRFQYQKLEQETLELSNQRKTIQSYLKALQSAKS